MSEFEELSLLFLETVDRTERIKIALRLRTIVRDEDGYK